MRDRKLCSLPIELPKEMIEALSSNSKCLWHGCEIQAIVSFHGVLQSNAMHIDYNEDGTVIFFNPNKPGGKRKEYKDGEKTINN